MNIVSDLCSVRLNDSYRWTVVVLWNRLIYFIEQLRNWYPLCNHASHYIRWGIFYIKLHLLSKNRGRGRGRGGRGAVRVDAETKDTENNENEINGNGNGGKSDGVEDWMETGEEEDERKIKESLALMNGQSGGKLD